MSASFWTHRSPAAFRRAHLPPAQQLPQVANRQLVQLRERLQVVLIGQERPGAASSFEEDHFLRPAPLPSTGTTSFDRHRARAISETCVENSERFISAGRDAVLHLSLRPSPDHLITLYFPIPYHFAPFANARASGKAAMGNGKMRHATPTAPRSPSRQTCGPKHLHPSFLRCVYNSRRDRKPVLNGSNRCSFAHPASYTYITLLYIPPHYFYFFRNFGTLCNPSFR